MGEEAKSTSQKGIVVANLPFSLSVVKFKTLLFLAYLMLTPEETLSDDIISENPDDILVVDCLLPDQIKRLGRISTFAGSRRPIKTTAVDCGIRVGEFVAYDRSNYQTATKTLVILS